MIDKSANALSWRRIRYLLYAIAVLGGLMAGLSLWFIGSKFAGALLLGVGLVLLNVWGTARFASALLNKQRKSLLWIAYPFKLLIDVAFVVWLIGYVQIDPIGFLAGLSTLAIGVVLFAFYPNA